MLPFIGRPWKTKTLMQSSEHGVVATGEQVHLLGRLFVDGIYDSWVLKR